MNLIFSEPAWKDYLHWQKANPEIVKRIHLLIADTLRNPRQGIGKPEPLKHALSGYWSRRIDLEHRFVYKMTKEGLWIVQLRYHY